ncbi:hypothetical protein FRB99_007578 [Tulasnella sp. 403]|nr:hypothetical protein FRB99_007578 [Tulasnella sp. 403]
MYGGTVVSARAVLLSNFEVFKLLQEQRAKQKAEFLEEVGLDNDNAQGSSNSLSRKGPGPPENLVKIQDETLAYLAMAPHPISRQNEIALKQLMRDLRPIELTKAEKLMVANLAPTTNVELYTIVEELEDRFPDRIEEIVDMVSNSLSAEPMAVDGSETIGKSGDVLPNGTDANGNIDAEGDVDDWAAEEQVYYDEMPYGGGDDLQDAMDED